MPSERDTILANLRAGISLCILRRDAPFYKTVLELEKEGLVTTALEQVDAKMSQLRVRLVCNTPLK